MSAKVKVLSTSTRTNLEALKHHMKKLGYSEFREDERGWIDFSTNTPFGYVIVHLGTFMYNINVCSIEKAHKIAETNQAILNFYEAEGITDED